MVEAPRSPVAGGVLGRRGDERRTSTPALSQNVRSSAASWRRGRPGWRSSNADAASLVLETAELDLAGAVVDDRRLVERQVVSASDRAGPADMTPSVDAATIADERDGARATWRRPGRPAIGRPTRRADARACAPPARRGGS